MVDVVMLNSLRQGVASGTWSPVKLQASRSDVNDRTIVTRCWPDVVFGESWGQCIVDNDKTIKQRTWIKCVHDQLGPGSKNVYPDSRENFNHGSRVGVSTYKQAALIEPAFKI
jgi:hypothetical protein